MERELYDLRITVYERIKKDILNRELQSGIKLTIEDLTKRFNVSPTPIKEALIALEKEGLVENIPRRGAFVSTLTLEDVEEIYGLKEVLEGLCGRKALEKINDTDINSLNSIISDAERFAKSNDILGYEEADRRFHQILREITEDKRLSYFLSILDAQLKLALPVINSLSGRVESSLQEHKKILSSLEKKNIQNAEFYSKEHMRLEREAVIRELKFRGFK
ncbi:MAG TPA: GntR family transcriptional regulator [bacterium]|nr:GntR family transcriptional regulator [Dictyoglomota bacterium]HOK29841.1 GntR family transcriptional regulator [bacterium]HOL54920.1 GntR family transcriptional regulator [bacterium]HPC78407.1 GntR family transcriptional regulator [bacterium]HRR91221.1 GntR family transcriptional regulator [bacterium]